MECQLGNTYSKNGLIIAINIFNFPLDYTDMMKALSYRYLFQYKNKYNNKPQTNLLQQRIREHYNDLLNTNRNNTVLLELTDIMLQFCPEIGEEMLNNVRNQNDTEDQKVFVQEINTRINNRKPKKPIIRAIHEDSQNVHNSKLNESVKKCAKNIHLLALKHGPLPSWENVKKQITDLFGPAPKVFKRINRDNATYGIGINLKTIFLSVWVWINNHKDQDELLIRLWQEFQEMRGYCSTGFLSRLVNIIQGFTDDPNLQITISDKEQCKSVVKHYLDTILKENPDMLDKMLEKSDDFIYFLLEKIDIKYDNWIEEYGEEFGIEMKKIINLYTDTKIFKI